MRTIQSLRPAVCLLILRQQPPRWSELVRIIYVHLIERDILQLTESDAVLIQVHGGQRLLKIGLGPSASGYRPQPFEEVFLQNLQQQPGAQIAVGSAVKVVKRSAHLGRMCKQIIRAPEYRRYFHEGFWHKLLGGFQLSEEGKRLRKQMEAEIRECDHLFNAHMANDPALAARLAQELGAYTLLLPSFGTNNLPGLLSQLDGALEAGEMPQAAVGMKFATLGILMSMVNMHAPVSRQGNSGCAGVGCGGGDGHSDGGDAGCSGCGGGGCSGCGGCGGCGG